MTTFIADGFTRSDGFIAAAIPEESGERLYESLSFTYRPATRLETVKLDAEIAILMRNKEIDAECAVRAERLLCKFVADRIVAWDLKNVGVHEVPVASTACENMHPYLFGHLYRVIRGIQVSDKKPDAKTSPLSDEDQQKN